MSYKKLPITLFPIIFGCILVALFTFVVPENGDLISPTGDYYLGQLLVYLFVVCLLLDVVRLFKHKRSNK